MKCCYTDMVKCIFIVEILLHTLYKNEVSVPLKVILPLLASHFTGQIYEGI